MPHYIKYVQEFKGANGLDFAVQSRDRVLVVAARATARAEAEARVDENGSPGKWDKVYEFPMIEKATFAQVIEHLLNDGEGWAKDDKDKPVRGKSGAEDMGRAFKVLSAFKTPVNGYVVLEKEDYDWILEWNKTEGPQALKMTQAVVDNRLRDGSFDATKPPWETTGKGEQEATGAALTGGGEEQAAE